jgi:NNP family nitrate/nitrite transporter-like MFS transporter
MTRLVAAGRLPIAWQACVLYAVAFGGYVAFSVYLPAYLKIAYGLEQTDGANRMAGFVVVAVVLRPVGGWLSDRIGAISVLAAVFGVVAACAAVQAGTPGLMPVGTIAFLTMAGGLGVGSGAVFGLVARSAPAAQVGSVTGLVGAAGGLGGFIPPLVMSTVYDRTGSYGLGLLLLALVCLGCLVLTLTVVRSTRHARELLAAA